MAIIQNRYLRAVAGAYNATPVEVLHAETMMLPIQEHLQAKAQSVSSQKKGSSRVHQETVQTSCGQKVRKRGPNPFPAQKKTT